MEPVTQALLGAATAEVVAGRALRGRALGWGAVIGMSPDLDVLLSGLHDGYGEWLYHRGTTHSLWFGFVMGPLLGWILWRWRDRGSAVETLPGWIRLSIIALVTHPLLDGFTPYGTQFFAPFLRDRFAWNGVAIVDPFYSVMLGAGVFIAARQRLRGEFSRRAVIVGLALSTLYLGAGLVVNQRVEADLRKSLGPVAPRIERVKAYPTIFQPWLRSFVVRTEGPVFVGLHSWRDWSCPVWRVYEAPAPSLALAEVQSTWEAELLMWFADGDVITLEHAEPGGGTRIRMEDVRYAWASPSGRGMWGLEARIDAEGQLLGRPARIARTGPAAADVPRLIRLLAGHLPDSASGWSRPEKCP